MRRGYALVEGQTEEAFVTRLVAPHVLAHGLHLTPIVVKTRRPADAPASRGGHVSYARWRDQLGRLLGDSSATVVTTMLDYYALPGDFPRSEGQEPPRVRAQAAQAALERDVGDPRFVAFVTLHEFEALVLCDPRHVCEAADAPGAAAEELARVRAAHSSPEDIDDGPNTHPSARLARLVPGYRKGTHGPIAAERIGLAAIRTACPHFDAWLRRLEAAARGD